MPEFTQSWAFTFIIGVISFAAGFALAIIIASGSRRSRAEERISGEAIHEAAKREEQRRGDYLSSKQMVFDVEDILGRKVG